MSNRQIERLKLHMKTAGLRQLLVSSAFHIEYYTGRHFYTVERFLGLIVTDQADPFLFLPEMIDTAPIPGFEIIKVSDSNAPAQVIGRYIHAEWSLGVDGTLPSTVLLGLIQNHAAKDYEDVSTILGKVRSVKDREEIQKMKNASAINDAVIVELKDSLREGITELEVQELLVRAYEARGYDGQYFGIISFGKNTADPHHMPDHTALRPGDAVLFDIGCRMDGYWSDMTRTYFFRTVSERARKLHEIVLRANLVGVAAIRPGVPLEEIDRAARDVIAQAGYGAYFTHRLGHQIGIEVHECADVRQGVLEPARPGMIFSCEPGIYIPEEDIGIRIEDLCLVTEQGVELMNHVSKELEILQDSSYTGQ